MACHQVPCRILVKVSRALVICSLGRPLVERRSSAPALEFNRKIEVRKTRARLFMPNSLSSHVAPVFQLTVVMPCFNEGETLASCIEKARVGIERAGMLGEILVADKASRDNSVLIAEKLEARVVHVKKRYGNALRGGIQAASGRWIVMATPTRATIFQQWIAS